MSLLREWMVLNSWHLKDETLLNTVKKTLNRRRLKKVIFITETPISESPISPSQQFREFFKWLHVQGFWNSLLMDLEGNSLAFDNLSKKFIRNLTLPEFLQNTINWPNLKGFPIRCSMGSNPPRTYIHYDNSNEVSLKGYYGTIINLFAKYYNASLKPFLLTDMDYFTELDCIRYIKEHKVDICGDVLTINTEYVITQPEMISASYLMVPYDKPLARFYYFLKPFQLHVWTIVNCSFFYKVITLAFIHRLQHGTWNASQQILYATLSVMFLPFHLTRVKGPYRKFLELIMILVGFVVANWYLSVLSSLLFARLYSHDIKSLEDLAHHNISIMVNDFDVYLLNVTENDPIIMQQLKVVSNDVLQQHRRNLDPHYAYYSQSDKIEFYLHQQKFLLRPRMKVLTGIPPINEVLAGIPMSPNWPFQHLLNDFIRRIAVSGLYQRLLVNAREEGISTGYLHYFPTEHHYVEPLSIEYFQMPAMLLAVGYSLALGGFLLEIFVFKKF
ncbi:hypothetical protein FF38_10347 [Lucilia cuprina]|uniref:Ionotropic glutamate receptor C-terminal domain-containing protein n=1 Tax=Lucilia cuprina TaxID=7375 RepID=A0A0L0CJM4_LUCCU|nr:hypothetical protein FF38_10347 [Lucilia cuprina]